MMALLIRVTAGLLLHICFCATSAFANPTHHIPPTGEEFGPDIPTVGSSLFDKLFSVENATGQTVYQVPAPLDALLKSLGGQSDRAVVHTMFPFSRSLQRPVDLRYDPLLNPRLVFASNRGALTRGKLFVGYVKATNQLEVISYNDEAGRFEFQLVKYYGTPDARVYYVDRGKCLSCHQGHAPIFSAPPWEDSSSGIFSGLFKEKLNLTESSTRDRLRKTFALLFDSHESEEEVAIVDSLVQTSNQISFDERVWLIGCGTDDACRLGLLLHTLVPTARGTNAAYASAQDRIEHSILKTQLSSSFFIGSTNLGVEEVARKYSPNGSMDLKSIVNSAPALLELIGNIYNLQGASNAANRRPLYLSDVELTPERLVNFNRYDTEAIWEGPQTVEEVARAIRRITAETPALIGPSALNKPRLMAALLSELKSPRGGPYVDWLQKKTAPKETFGGPLPPVFQRPGLNLLSRYCSQCHASGAHFPPQFLIGKESEVMDAIRALRPRLLLKLQNGLMPPFPDARELMKSSGDLERIVNFINTEP